MKWSVFRLYFLSGEGWCCGPVPARLFVLKFLQEHPNPTYLIFACYTTKGIAKWLDPKWFALKHQTCKRVTPSNGDCVCTGVGGWVSWLGGLRDDALPG